MSANFLRSLTLLCLLYFAAALVSPQTPAPQRAPTAPSQADILRGGWGPYRANNDLLSYHLDVRLDPDKRSIGGKNTIRFKMLKDDSRIQLDLFANLKVDKIVFGATELKYERQFNAVFVDFPQALKKNRVYSIDFYYSGQFPQAAPGERGINRGVVFQKDASGHHWVNTSCQHLGASAWWPNKDQYRDEVQHMRLSVAIPNGLVDVSNGKFLGKTDLGDGYTRWDWLIQYPINNYSVSLNVGNYVHFADSVDGLPLNFYCLPEDLEKAKRQFVQAKSMIQAFQKYLGPYPFKKDGYKLIQVPYSGMEHQSAVTYGNRFANGYLERDWTGVGISTRFDFIIVHESAHEWFGNSITAADVADEWIHEAWGTYAEAVYVEHMWGKEDALKYLNGYKPKIANRQPIVAPRGVNRTPPQDMYFKGALFINTLRSVIDNDARWWSLVRDFYGHFKYHDITTEDVAAFFSKKTGKNLTPMFDEYLRHTELPTLELQFQESDKTVSYRWKASEPAFAMPIKVGRKGQWQTIQPTASWKTMKCELKTDEFEVATNLYLVNVTRK